MARCTVGKGAHGAYRRGSEKNRDQNLFAVACYGSGQHFPGTSIAFDTRNDSRTASSCEFANRGDSRGCRTDGKRALSLVLACFSNFVFLVLHREPIQQDFLANGFILGSGSWNFSIRPRVLDRVYVVAVASSDAVNRNPRLTVLIKANAHPEPCSNA